VLVLSTPHQVAVDTPVVECLIHLHGQQAQGGAVDAPLCCCQGLQRIVGLAAVGGTCVTVGGGGDAAMVSSTGDDERGAKVCLLSIAC
jgi:hypothetical protein